MAVIKKTKRKAVEDRLREMARGGRLTPEAVVEEARRPSSPLNSAFPKRMWEDTWAAQQYREALARRLISSFIVRAKDEDGGRVKFHAPMFVRDPRLEHDQQGYMELVSVRKRTQMARVILAAETARVVAGMERTYAIAQEVGLEDEYENVLAFLSSLADSAEAEG